MPRMTKIEILGHAKNRKTKAAKIHAFTRTARLNMSCYRRNYGSLPPPDDRYAKNAYFRPLEDDLLGWPRERFENFAFSMSVEAMAIEPKHLIRGMTSRVIKHIKLARHIARAIS